MGRYKRETHHAPIALRREATSGTSNLLSLRIDSSQKHAFIVCEPVHGAKGNVEAGESRIDCKYIDGVAIVL